MPRSLALSALLLVSCLQGPWDYWPDPPEPYRGIWVSGHVIAGWPLKSVCFEKLNALDETHTDAFAFYDSATVTVSGDFGSGDTTLTLSPTHALPNCFDGSGAIVPLPDHDYHLSALIHWDSAGENISSHLTGTAHTPTQFRITSALAPAQAMLATGELPPEVVDALLNAFGDTLLTIASDTMALVAFFEENQDQIDQVLNRFRTPYQDGDTVYYLNGSASLSSHYYLNERSDDVAGVLATMHFDSTSGQGGTSFDNLFGDPDTSWYIIEGNTNRLLYIPSFIINGSNYLDSIPLINSWYHPGWTTFYFFAGEDAYNQYIMTAIEQSDDSRIRKVYNIDGGAGFFAGMLVDSFHVFTDTVPGTPFYSFVRARELYCEDDGWLNSKACRAAYPQFCADSGWTTPDCAPLAIANHLDTSSSASIASLGLKVTGAALDSAVATGKRLHCIESGFASDDPDCAQPIQECLESREANHCNALLWDWCEDQSWPIDSLDQCGTGLASYMNIIKPKSTALERERDRWCAAHPSDPQCGP